MGGQIGSCQHVEYFLVEKFIEPTAVCIGIGQKYVLAAQLGHISIKVVLDSTETTVDEDSRFYELR